MPKGNAAIDLAGFYVMGHNNAIALCCLTTRLESSCLRIWFGASDPPIRSALHKTSQLSLRTAPQQASGSHLQASTLHAQSATISQGVPTPSQASTCSRCQLTLFSQTAITSCHKNKVAFLKVPLPCRQKMHIKWRSVQPRVQVLDLSWHGIFFLKSSI